MSKLLKVLLTLVGKLGIYKRRKRSNPVDPELERMKR